jgi:putative nucleotidyltransferase with HDIG domain
MKPPLSFSASTLRDRMETPRGGNRAFWITFFVLLVLIAYFLYLPESSPDIDSDLKAGDIAREDIIVPQDITLQDDFSTREKMQDARQAVPPVYEAYALAAPHPRLNDWFEYMRQSRRRYLQNNQLLNTIRVDMEKRFGIEISPRDAATILRSSSFFEIDLNQLLDLLQSLRETGIIASKLGAIKNPDGSIQRFRQGEEARILKVDALYDLKDVRTTLERFLRNQTMPESQIQLVLPVLMEFVDVNLSYSPNLTNSAREAAANSVNSVMIRLKAGKVILRKGDEITPADMRLIRLISLEAESKKQLMPDFILILVAMGMILYFLVRLSWIPASSTLNNDKLPLVMVVTLAVSAAIYRMSVFLLPLVAKNMSLLTDIDQQGILFAIPFGTGALIIAFVFNLQSAVVFSFANAIAGAIVSGWNFQISLYILLGNLAVAFGIEHYQRLKRSPILKAAVFWLLPVNILFIVLMDLTRAEKVDSGLILLHLGMGAFSAFLAPLLANFIIPLWEIIFKLVTDLKLIELTNLNLPVFREMLEKAPGTYHHSQMVASLAESCAQDLKLSPLLLTAMALYHDIGKINNPQFFTENQTIYPDPHEKLSPRESARMIISHLSDGVEEARKLKLPQPIRDAILQHHGTKTVHYFYEKAQNEANVDTDEVDPGLFRYSGPKPQNIENAIIMLADQVEAASKTLSAPTNEEIRNIIDRLSPPMWKKTSSMNAGD